MKIAGAGTVKLYIKGKLTINTSDGAPAIDVPEGTNLEIYSFDGTDSGGTLTASNINGTGAGIGGGQSQNSGNITIYSGTVSTTSTFGAGIGGGSGGNGSVTITGGTVFATSTYGAGIGGGGGLGLHGGNGGNGNVTINGGTVFATSTYGAGIGGGGGLGLHGGNGGNGSVTITGGTVFATSTNAAGIGGGGAVGGLGRGGKQDVKISDAVVFAKGKDDSHHIPGLENTSTGCKTTDSLNSSGGGRDNDEDPNDVTGVFFLGVEAGFVCGTPTLKESFSIPMTAVDASGHVVETSSSSLTIADGKAITLSATTKITTSTAITGDQKLSCVTGYDLKHEDNIYRCTATSTPSPGNGGTGPSGGYSPTTPTTPTTPAAPTTPGVDPVTGEPVQPVSKLPSERLGGADRAATALAVQAKAKVRDKVILVSPTVFADGVSAGALAAALGVGVLPATPAVLEKLPALGVKEVIIIGGLAAVAEPSLPGVKTSRLAGANRYETSAVIARFMLDAGLADGKTVYTATGANFADALAASAAAARTKGLVLLVDSANTSALGVIPAGAKVVCVGGLACAATPNAASRIVGVDRYATAKLLLQATNQATGTKPSKLLLATGASWPDALWAGPLADAGTGLLLRNPADANPLVPDYVKQVIKIGGQTVNP